MVGHKYVAVTSFTWSRFSYERLGFKDIDVINPNIFYCSMIPLWNGFTSNIVDVKKDTLCIDPEDVERYKKPNSEAQLV